MTAKAESSVPHIEATVSEHQWIQMLFNRAIDWARIVNGRPILLLDCEQDLADVLCLHALLKKTGRVNQIVATRTTSLTELEVRILRYIKARCAELNYVENTMPLLHLSRAQATAIIARNVTAEVGSPALVTLVELARISYSRKVPFLITASNIEVIRRLTTKLSVERVRSAFTQTDFYAQQRGIDPQTPQFPDKFVLTV